MLSPASEIFCKILPLTKTYQKRLLSLVKMTSQSKWKIEKNKIVTLPLEEKRLLYRTKEYVILDKVDPWFRYVVKNKQIEGKKHTLDDLNEFKKIKLDSAKNKLLTEKVSLYKGDITQLEIDAIVNAANSRLEAGGEVDGAIQLQIVIDAIVNAANSRLKAGGGVDGAIHRAAGPLLQEECNSLQGCPTGDAKITGGYDLPAKYIIHTVGPQDGSATKLQSCYEKCFSILNENRLTSIAFPCISTGIYGFPNRLAAHIALSAARKALEANEDIERVIFCTFMPIDVEIYETLMQMYFPVHDWNYNDGASVSE